MSQQLWEEIVKGVSVSSRKVQPSLTLTRVNSKPSITLPTWRALPKDRFEDSTDLQVLDQLFSPLSSLSSDSFLINLRLHPFALFQDFLLLARPPPLPPPPPPLPLPTNPGNMADPRSTNEQHPDDSSWDFSNFTRFVRSIGRWKPVRKMAATLDQLRAPIRRWFTGIREAWRESESFRFSETLILLGICLRLFEMMVHGIS